MDQIDVAYRLYRLRRLIAATTLPPVAMALILFPGPLGWCLGVVAGLAMVAHAVRFPTAWEETIVVSAVLSAGWLLLAALGAVTGTVGFLLGLPFVIAALGVLFMQLSVRIWDVLALGEAKPLRFRCTRSSSLPVDELRPRVTLWPGRSDLRTRAGAADDDGVFPVSIGHRMPSLFCEDGEAFDVAFHARVEASDDTRHMLTAMNDEGDVLSKTTHSFRATKRGSRVTVEEEGAPMPTGLRLGFWLQDFGADHLTDEVDRAEGRMERANRFAGRENLLTLFGALMMARMQGDAAGDA